MALSLQVPCPGDTINRDCDSLLFEIKSFCEEIGYSSKIKGKFFINKGNQCTSRDKSFVHTMFEIVSLQMYMNDRGPISGPLVAWNTTPPTIQKELKCVQQSLINYVWEKQVPNANVFFPGEPVSPTMPFCCWINYIVFLFHFYSSDRKNELSSEVKKILSKRHTLIFIGLISVPKML